MEKPQQVPALHCARRVRIPKTRVELYDGVRLTSFSENRLLEYFLVVTNFEVEDDDIASVSLDVNLCAGGKSLRIGAGDLRVHLHALPRYKLNARALSDILLGSEDREEMLHHILACYLAQKVSLVIGRYQEQPWEKGAEADKCYTPAEHITVAFFTGKTTWSQETHRVSELADFFTLED